MGMCLTHLFLGGHINDYHGKRIDQDFKCDNMWDIILSMKDTHISKPTTWLGLCGVLNSFDMHEGLVVKTKPL